MSTDEIDEMGIDLVLEQGGAGAGAAASHIPRIEHPHIITFGGECLGDERTGDARSENGDITSDVGTEGRIVREDAVPHGPVGMIRGEIHVRAI